MTMKTFFIRFAGLIVIALLAGPLYAITVNFLVLTNMIPPDLVDKAYGNVLTLRTIYVWIGCLLVGFASIFARGSWRYIFYFSPLYATPIFAVVYTMLQS